MGHRRGRSMPRCPGCGLTAAICACGALPRLRFSTPLAIVQHARERYKPTNTGRLLARLVEGTVVLPCGVPERPFDPKPLEDPSIEWRVLFPREGAPVLDPGRRPGGGRRLGFVLLDGSWRQCAHMSRRLPGIVHLPVVALPSGPPSFWTVRTQPREQGRSTFEAGMRVLELFEGADAVSPLRRAFALVTAGMLCLKGKLPTPEIPAAWGV